MILQRNIAITALIAALIGLGLGFVRGPGGQAISKQETAYERVMRTRTLHCGYAPWPVTEEIDPNTKAVKGMVPDFTTALGQKLGLKIEWTQEVIWGQEPEALATGKIDAVCSTDGPWSYTSAAVVDYTEPMAFFPVYLTGREHSAKFTNLSEVNSPSITFSSIEGDISLAMPMDKFPKAHRFELPGSADPGLLMTNIVDGKADLVVLDALTTDQFNKNNDKKLARLYDKPMAVINMSFCVGKGQGDLLQMLNQGFRLLESLGISDEILDRYDPEHKLFYRPAKHWQQAAN